MCTSLDVFYPSVTLTYVGEMAEAPVFPFPVSGFLNLLGRKQVGTVESCWEIANKLENILGKFLSPPPPPPQPSQSGGNLFSRLNDLKGLSHKNSSSLFS